MLVTQNQPAPIGGVSQLPVDLRSESQVEEAVNTFPSPTRGLGVRQGTTAVGVTGHGATKLKRAEFSPSPNERYEVLVDTSGLRVIDAVTGAVQTVSTRSITSALSPDLSTFYTAPRGFTLATIGGDVYVASRGYSKAELAGSPTPAAPDTAIVQVVTGAPSAFYKLVIDGITIAVRTPDDPAPAAGVIDTTPGVVPPSITMSGLTTPLVIEQSASDTRQFSVVRAGDVKGNIALVTSGLPTGVTASWSPASVSPVDNMTTLTLAVGSAVPLGVYTVAVEASGDGQESDWVYFNLDVRYPGTGGSPPPPPPPGSGFVLTALGATSYTLNAGTYTQLSDWGISVAGTFTSPVAISGGNAMPAGMSLSWSNNLIYPPGAGAQSSTPFLTIPASTPPGTYNVPVTGYATGYPAATAYITVTVVSGGSTGTAGGFSAQGPVSSSLPAAGDQNQFLITTTRSGGYGGLIDFSFSSVEDTITVIFSPPSLDAATPHCVATIYSDVSTPDGDYTVTITASSAGKPDVSWDMTLHIGTTG